MEDKNNDNIYIYNEEPDSLGNDVDLIDDDLDKSGPNYSQVNSELEDDNLSEENIKSHAISPLKLMVKVMMHPVEGWKSVRRAALTPECAQQECFFPLLALLSISKFILMAYYPNTHLADTLINAICSFVSFFFSYFCIIIILKMFLSGESKKTFESNFGKVFIIISLSSLSLFDALADFFPMLWAVLIFLPLWTIYMICRGTRFLKFPKNKQMTFTFILCLLIVGLPISISWILGILLNH